MTGCALAYLTSKFVKRSAVLTRTSGNSEMFSTPHHASALLVANGPLNIERRHCGLICNQH